MRAQASLFDGITFLLLTSASMAMALAFLGTYGTYQDAALRSAHMLNYLHAAMKAFYFLDISTLANVKSEGIPIYADLDQNCSKLKQWSGKLSVAEIVKKDLSDRGDVNDSRLDDLYGKGGPFTPGKLAMRCAMKEIMKPFSYAGYRYLVDFINEYGTPLGRISVGEAYPVPRITNSELEISDCEDVVDALKALNKTPQIFAVSTPFRVLQENETKAVGEPRRFIARFCLWQE